MKTKKWIDALWSGDSEQLAVWLLDKGLLDGKQKIFIMNYGEFLVVSNEPMTWEEANSWLTSEFVNSAKIANESS